MSLRQRFNEKEWQRLRERAERVEQAVKPDTRTLLDVLLLWLGGERYALPVQYVRAVYDDIPLTPLPGTPPFIAGIANVRGRLLTVLDLAYILEMSHAPDSEQTLVVLAAGDFPVGLLVEQVSDVVQLPLDELTPVTDSTVKTNYLQGVLATGTTLLNIDSLLNDRSLVVDDSL